MHKHKAMKSTTTVNRLSVKATDAQVVVLTKMDSLTQFSTATIRRDMAESVKKDVKVLKKFGLLTTG